MRIYVPDAREDSYVVIFTELAANTGQSVTNCVERLAAEIVTANVLPSSRTVFVEHYERAARGGDAESYDLVTFAERDPEPHLRAGRWTIELGEPSWQFLDRGSVETLLGASLGS